ncbi:MAG: methyltransferase [Actinomycetaceae bacterium]|nr:methyltransferase [Actinomycetaceae bacterium]
MSEHYFSAQPTTSDKTRTFDITLGGEDFTVTTASGVFSSDGLDKGTRVFLHKAPFTELPEGALAVDLGCGWGPLSLVLGREYPQAEVIGVDINERALELANQNAQANGLANVSARDSAEVAKKLATSGRKIDLLWSNPPIRIGKKALHELLLTWLNLLADDGNAYLVVQKNLGADSLTKWLNEQGFPTVKIGSSAGFRILHVRRG